MRPQLICTFACVALFASALRAAEPDQAGMAFFEKKIRPVLVAHCYSCHSTEAQSAKKLKGGLLLDSKATLLKGGDSGPAIVAGKPDDSLLIKGLRHTDELRMPPKGKLPATIVADFETWIKMGAPDPRDSKASSTGREINMTEGRKFWAFQPPRKHLPPQVKDASWPKGDIDRFILAGLEAKGLRPVRPATKRELIRRATFDLIGLPPTPEEVEAFLQDESAEAFARVVERLLRSPHHGERWARYWLDVARFAEDQAHTFAVTPFTQAFRYRDWVIKALNDDMPYDRFVKLQLAGDLMPDAPSDPFEKVAGLGFLGLGVSYYKNTAAAQAIADELDDRIDTLTRGFLGLTVACARCHDHKFDPIPTRDYYSLAGIYNSSDLKTQMVAPPAEIERYNQAQQRMKSKDDQIKKWLAEMAKKKGKKNIPKEQEGKLLSSEEMKELAQMRAELETVRKSVPPKPPEVHVIAGGGKAMRVYIRGNPAQQGEPAPKGFLQVLSAKTETSKDFGRLELANAIASKDNPLTARVIVNRVWQHHFGRGLVGTPSNFGQLGERPTHPELLDWLAVRFVENGWSLKKLHRDILLSATYQLSSSGDARNAEVDGDNRLLWRMNRHRLDVEAMRDSLLAVSGKLDRTAGGPPQEASARNNLRRTIYARISRHRLDPTLNLFDFPDPNVTSAARPVTTIPQQQLFVLNSEFVVDQAQAFAKRLENGGGSDQQKIARAFELAYNRPPTGEETQLGLAFLSEPTGKDDRLTRWEQYAQVLLGTNEFLYVD
jgi:cytochrome c553